MKRLLAVLTAVCLCFGTCACNSGVTEPATEPSQTTVPTTVPPTTAAPTTESTTEPTAAPSTETTAEPTTAPTTEPTTEPTAEPTTEPTTEAATAPATEPATQPAAPAELLCDTLYRLSDAVGEGRTKAEILEEEGISEDAWFVRFADGTGLMALKGGVERIFFGEDCFWNNARVFDYEMDSEGIFTFTRNYGDSTYCFAPVEEPVPGLLPEAELFPRELAEACEGVWEGKVSEEGAGEGRLPGGTAVTAELTFDENGRCSAAIWLMLGAVCDQDAVAACHADGLDGLMIYGRIMGQPFLADSNMILDADTLCLHLRIGDPTAADTYTVDIPLYRPDPGAAVG